MNEARELKEIKQFATGNKVRDLIIKEISPTVQKVEEECQQIRREMKIFKQNYSSVLRFENEKGVLEKNSKQLTRHLFELKNQVAALKSETDLAQAMNTANNSNIKEEILSFERGLARREETLLSYDKRLNGIMDSLSKHQNYVGDRLTIFQQKFAKLSKETLEMTKDIKKEFDSCNLNNQLLKNELITKLKQSEVRQGILDLFMREREENAQKILQIQQSLAQMVRTSEFQQYKRIQKGFIDDSYSKITTFLENALPNQTLCNLKLMNLKFAEIEELKQRSRKVEEEIKRSIKSVEQSIKSIEQAGEETMAKIRTENQEIQDKIIEEIDKRFQTIQENIEQRGTQTEVDLEAKLKQLQQDIELAINLRLEKQDRDIYEIKAARTLTNNQGEEKMISKQLQTAKAQRQKIQSYGVKVKEIADGLNDKLVLFGNRITMCRSDIEIFTADTKKQLKKISSIKLQLQNNMETVGKLLASIAESITILTSLSISAQRQNENNVFSTYHDGLILQVEPKLPEKQIIYRRHITKTSNLKESLLYCLLNTIDQTILNIPALKWDCYKPSEFYRLIRDNLDLKAKASVKNGTLSIHSARKRQSNKIDEEQTYFQLRKDGEETNTGHQKSRVTVTNANTLWPLQRPNSELQRRYKIKKPQQLMARRQSEERHCFTASRSHRKTKISYI